MRVDANEARKPSLEIAITFTKAKGAWPNSADANCMRFLIVMRGLRGKVRQLSDIIEQKNADRETGD
jgi:hypothetical protein